MLIILCSYIIYIWQLTLYKLLLALESASWMWGEFSSSHSVWASHVFGADSSLEDAEAVD